MNELPSPWDEFARLQETSSRITKIDSYSWGKEEEMNSFLERCHAQVVPSALELERTRTTAARRERSRIQFLEEHQTELTSPSADPIHGLEAREEIRQVAARLTLPQWELILAFALGADYAEIASGLQLKPAAARRRVHRIRQLLLKAA
jgi:DNA-directed RNA polymerase specialized sigma24 family protein